MRLGSGVQEVGQHGKRAETQQGQRVAGGPGRGGGAWAVAADGGGLFRRRRGGFGLSGGSGGDAGEGGFDARGVEGARVEQVERCLRVAVGKGVAEIAAGGLDVREQVFREKGAVSH